MYNIFFNLCFHELSAVSVDFPFEYACCETAIYNSIVCSIRFSPTLGESKTAIINWNTNNILYKAFEKEVFSQDIQIIYIVIDF